MVDVRFVSRNAKQVAKVFEYLSVETFVPTLCYVETFPSQ